VRPTAAQRLLHAARDSGVIDAAALEESLSEARRAARDPVDLATTRLRVPREALYRALAHQRGLPFLPADALTPEPGLLGRAPAHLLQRKQVLPLRIADGRVLVATADPDDASTQQALRRALRLPLDLAVAEPPALEAALRRHLPGGEGAPAAPAAFDAVRFLDDLLAQACLRRASDVHVDPQPEGTRLRLRVDGHLVPAGPLLAADDAQALLSRIKVLGGLDIAERREAQDGGFRIDVAGQDLDVRLATIPTRLGERATLRLLGAESVELTVDRLGFAPDDRDRFRDALARPHGMVLLTGPTGSGKTTTLYAALEEVATPNRNVLTVEDPVERQIAGVSQVPVDRAGKVTFAGALRSLLRHDPDIIMVGEVRDGETADVAIKAAMTGHLVLSSLHANRAAGAPARLRDLGCPSYLIASTLRAVVAQRLVRRLCERCCVRRSAEPDELRRLDPERGDERAPVWEPHGCPSCVGTGFHGRLAVVEGLWLDDELARAVGADAHELELRRLAAAGGVRTLGEDALAKVLAGRTSLGEALGAAT